MTRRILVTETQLRQLAFDIVMGELNMDDSDMDDQAYASEAVDEWIKHWHARIETEAAVTDEMVERACRAFEESDSFQMRDRMRDAFFAAFAVMRGEE